MRARTTLALLLACSAPSRPAEQAAVPVPVPVPMPVPEPEASPSAEPAPPPQPEPAAAKEPNDPGHELSADEVNALLSGGEED